MNIYNLFKNKNGDYIFITPEELHKKLDWERWYFTSKELYISYRIYFSEYAFLKIGDALDIDQMFSIFKYIKNNYNYNNYSINLD